MRRQHVFYMSFGKFYLTDTRDTETDVLPITA